MATEPVAAFADALLEAHRAGHTCTVAAGIAPRSVAEAYRVQQRVLERLAYGARPQAWKVSPAPAGGEILASPVPPRLERSPAAISAGTRTILGIEAEVAFRFAATPPGAASVADVRAAVGEMVALIELCETRLTGWQQSPALAKLADFQSHGAFVVGSGTRDLDRDFAAQRVELQIEGRTAARAAGSHPTGRLWEMVAWAVSHCAGRGMPLQAGDIVTTGSWTGLVPIAPGEEAVARFAGIGEARLALT
jgi:2-keto-4-pentenoate hydratase